MLIRKNTKAFKTILEIITACRDRPDREALIRLYITKAGDTINDRISVEGIEGGAGLFYEMNYQAVLGNLKSSNHQLQQSDEAPGIYFFHSSSNKVWDETPFEFDEAIKKDFGTLPDLPALRKKGKAEKFTFPAANVKSQSRRESKSARQQKGSANKKGDADKKAESKKENGEPKKSARVVAMWPKQPDYKLNKDIHFTGLERIIVRQAQLTKRNILDYYNKIAEYLLPYLKDRPQVIRLHRDGHQGAPNATLESLTQNSHEEIPDWIRTASVGKGKAQEQLLLCNDREHLLFYVQMGCLEFRACHSRLPSGASAKAGLPTGASAKVGTKSVGSPDYIVLSIEPSDYEIGKAIQVALTTKEILTGLKLPSFVKTDGSSGLHIYIPLDSKNDFEASKQSAEYLSKLVRLKIPDLVALKGSEDHAYGKVTLDYSINEQTKSVIAPYSLVAGQAATVATPLMWQEVTDGLDVEAFNHETIFTRLKEEGDPFKDVFKKKVNADTLVARLEEHYSFLF